MRRLISYITEAFVQLFVIAVLFCALIFNAMSAFAVDSSIYFFAILIGLLLAIYNGSNSLRTGTKALADLLFRQSIVRKGVITDVIPFERSTFSDKWGKNVSG